MNSIYTVGVPIAHSAFKRSPDDQILGSSKKHGYSSCFKARVVSELIFCSGYSI